MKRLLAGLFLGVALLVLSAGASALPGDPPILPLTPADGAGVAADASGIPVTFQCPAYSDGGDYSDYAVRFAADPGVGADGRLATHPYGNDAATSLGADGLTCTAKLDTFDTGRSPEIVGGRVYWQAYRLCNGCARGWEAGPVRSFVVRADVRARLTAPARVYAGYLNVFRLQTESRFSDAQVLLQRRSGKRWTTLVRTGFKRGITELVAALPAGRQRVRVRIVLENATLDVARRTLLVRRGVRRVTSGRDDGRYAARKPPRNSTLSFKIAAGGTKLRGFRASLSAFCIGPTPADNRVVIAFARLDSARIAPDGSVTGLLELRSGARVLLTGRVRHRRFKGEVSMAFSTCSGSRKLDAIRL